MEIEYLMVKRGDPLSAALWNRLVAAVKALRVKGGLNTRVDHMDDGQVVHFDPPTMSYDHPWKPMLSGDRVTFQLGYVTGMEPRIKGVPMSGTDREPAPSLKLNASLYDASGVSYLALEAVRAGDRGAAADALDPERLGIVQVREVPGLSTGGVVEVGGLVRWPLAVLKRNPDEKDSAGRVIPIAMFHLGHRYAAASKRHFFPAATNI